MIEQWHTIEEAEKLWCPMMPQREIEVTPKRGMGAVDLVNYVATWRTEMAACIGPRCMAWVENRAMGPDEFKGRCGMVAP